MKRFSIGTYSMYFLTLLTVGCVNLPPGDLSDLMNIQEGSNATPTPEPTPAITGDFGLQVTLLNPGLSSAFLSTDTLLIQGNTVLLPSISDQIQWSFIDENYLADQTTAYPTSYQGSLYTLYLLPKPLDIPTPYSGLGRNYPLAYQIRAIAEHEGQLDFEMIEIRQDNLAELRQEYLDFSNTPPEIGAFDSWVPTGRFAPLLVRDNEKGVCVRHESWIVWDLLLACELADLGFHTSNSEYIVFTSGYRCPAGNKRVGGGIESVHLQGKAADWDQGSGYSNWQLADFLRNDAVLLDISVIILYDQYETKYYWIRDIQDDIPTSFPSGVNYTHGHVDWR